VLERDSPIHSNKCVAVEELDSTKTEGIILFAVILAASITVILIAIGNQNLISIEF
jgi:hypothetical protein